MCPAADGTPALPPTYEEIDHYLATIDLVSGLGAAELHSGHWPLRRGAEIAEFCRESRAFVEAMDAALLERLEAPATLRQLCDHAEERLGPFNADPVNLMFAVHGHLRRMSRRGQARPVDAAERPPRYQRLA
jgi:hypothetical protein